LIPVLFPLAHFFGAYGITASQAVADLLSLTMAIPICILTLRKIKEAEQGKE
jgi:hypothetical protein